MSGSLQTDSTERCVELNGCGLRSFAKVQQSGQEGVVAHCFWLLTLYTSYEDPSNLHWVEMGTGCAVTLTCW